MTHERLPLLRRIRGLAQRHAPGMITCREFDEFVSSYFDHTLSANHTRLFERHLRFCPECRSFLKAYETSIALGAGALGHADDRVPEDVPEELVAAILDAIDKPASDALPD